jgi:hypothetical protein
VTGPEPYPESGELIQNGGMESFTGTVPTGWASSTPTLVSKVTAQGRVHSGNSAVNLKNTAVLTQTINDINPGCFYEFSFFAHGKGTRVGFSATVNFLTPGGDVLGATINVRQRDVPTGRRIFAFYRVLTIEAPANATGARVDFSVTANGKQSLDLDDVSFRSQ